MIRSHWKVLVSFVVAGCGAEQASSVVTVEASSELRAIGVQSLTLIDRHDELTIIGVDDTGLEIAQLDLAEGRFFMEEDGRFVDGRQLSVQVLGLASTHESEGRYGLRLPQPANPTNRAFLGDPSVEAALAGHGIEFQVKVPAALTARPEVPNWTCNDMYHLYDQLGGNSSGACTYGGCADFSCSQVDIGGGEYGEYRCCNNRTVAFRICSSPNASTACGTTGGNGCVVCWSDGNFFNSMCQTWAWEGIAGVEACIP